MLKFRDLKADEIDVRVAQIGSSWIQLLLYKDARVDMNILDETVEPENWERVHKELKGNIYCGIGIRKAPGDPFTYKWDAGKESQTESEKGEASDSFKRAGTNWGIGRELYTSPPIFINHRAKNGEFNYELDDSNGRKRIRTKFKVMAIEITKKEITGIAIKNDENKRVFTWKKGE